MKLKRMLVLAGTLCCLTACSEEVVDTYVAPLTVNTIQPSIEDFETLGNTVASLEPGSRVVLLPTVQGELLQINASLGEYVRVGDLIAIIDNDAAQTQVENAEDAVNRAMDSINTITEGMLVKAPVSGYVQSIDETYNHSVTASSQLAYLSNQKQMTVKIPFLDTYVDSSWIGKQANLTFVETGETILGTVSKISGATDYLYGNVAVNYITITVDNPGGIPVGRKVAASVNGISCSDNGAFESEASSPVISGLNGTIDEIYVSVGQYVTAGTTMFRITSTGVESQLKSAQDGLSDAVTARSDAYDLLADYRVYANVSGTISNVLAKKFDTVSPSTGLIEVSTTNHMEVTFSVSEAVLPFLYLGQELDISSQGKEVKGSISEISSVASTQTGLFTVIGVITGEDVLTGTSAQVEYTDFLVKDALVVPFEAVHFVGEQCYIFVVEQNEAVKKEIEVAQFTADKIIVTEGLSSSDVVISSWSTQLRNGLPVSPSSENSTTDQAPSPEEESLEEVEEELEDVSN